MPQQDNHLHSGPDSSQTSPPPMASLLTTMFVPYSSSPSAQPLPPHFTLKQSSSCVTVNTYTFLETPRSPAYSPSSRAAQLLRDGLTNSPNSDSGSPSSNARTRGQFKPQRTGKGTTSYQLRQFAEATLGSGSLRKAVKLPEGEDLNEWLAVNGTIPEEKR
jgi:MOB kinase activator 1